MPLLVTEDRDVMEAAIEDVEIAAGWVPRELILKAPRLRWFQQWAAGADWLTKHPEAVGTEWRLTNTAGIHAIQIGEHVLGMMLAFARQLPRAYHAQARREWDHIPMEELFELNGRTLLIIGVGAIGARIAHLASAFGMRVIGTRNNPEKRVDHVERLEAPDELHELLPEAHFVVMAAPLTQETRAMMNAAAFARMRPDAYFINIGRGGTVDEAAMIQALREGRIAGVGLDVFAKEPLPEDSPLWSMENVILTGHYSGATPHYHARAMEIFLDNLERYQEGRRLRNLVDKARGY